MLDPRHLTEEEVIRLLGEAQAERALLGYVPEEIRLILEKWIEFKFGEARPVEWLMLDENDLVAEWRQRQRIDNKTDAAWRELQRQIASSMEGETAQFKDSDHLVIAIDGSLGTGKSGRKRIYAWLGAAASVLAAASILLLIRLNHRVETGSVQREIVRDLAPGGRHATLKLANGQQILLDTVRSRYLTLQGNSVLHQDSSLSYVGSRHQTGLPAIMSTLSTPPGGEYRVTLPDGTRAWLNASSSITYPTAFNGKTRDVTITGEVYLEVVHNARQPFRIHAEQLTVEDIGTALNIRSYPGENQVATLVEGSIKVASGSTSKILVPGQQAEIAKDGAPLVVKNGADTAEVVAWKNGRFLFTDASIGDILREVSRWYDVDVLDSSAVGIHFFMSVPRNVPLSALMRAVERTHPLHYRIEGRKLVLTP